MKPRLRVHLSAYFDETSRLCHWHVPETHYLEHWSDAQAFDGTVTIVQPLINPLYESRSGHEIVSLLQGRYRSGYDSVREYWRNQRPGADFERFWKTALNDGVVSGTGSAAPMAIAATTSGVAAGTQPAPQQGQTVRAPQRQVAPLVALQTPGSGESDLEVGPASLELIFRPDPTVYDGRFSNNGWLQELPKPLTKLTWDNAALLSPRTAERLGVRSEDVVELRYRGAAVQAPVWVLPGHADECVTVHFGYGREYGGKLAKGAGFNAYRLRQLDAPWGGPGLEVRKTGERRRLATTQTHWSIEGRDVVRTGTVEEYRQNPHFVHEKAHGFGPEVSLYPEYDYEGNAWGMAIDLNACLGCNACVVACQAENNIPVVGKDQVIKQREMHWLRIDTYHEGNLDNPKTVHQPMLCQHCEKAPCEVVCPVAATVHSSEGLNDMVYNRCVGTRYCSNNCPYKVRRFNFLQYTDKETPSLKIMHNPDVTVRDRGVMEKCTYCVQRINAARIEAKKEDRPIRDGEVVTACQAACPTHAIVFGNINDPNSQVAKLKKLSLNYSVLGELNTQPRTTYLAALRNPNPELGTE
jgi:molybdopterin-containing oxidoreductase family iron-sulfur binding subunit